MQKNILYIGNKLAKHGFSLSSIETLGPLLEKEGYKLVYASDKKNMGLRLLSMVAHVFRYGRSTGLVLIDTYSSAAFWYAWCTAWACRILGIKYIPILRGGNMPARMVSSPKLTKQVFGHSHINVVVSDYLKQCVEECGFRYELIPNNIDLVLYKFTHRTQASPRLLWVRAFHTVYNPSLALQVVKRLSEQYPGITLTMVGPKKDGTWEQCHDLAKELGIADRVTFTGKLSKEEWRKLSEQHDIFINTTNFDNLPISVLEALALGMPVISTNVGGVPYLITHNKNGLLVEPRNEDQMIAAITSLLTNNELTARLSQAARSSAELYDWRTIRHQWNELLTPIASRSQTTA